LGAIKPKDLKRIAKIGYGHLCLVPNGSMIFEKKTETSKVKYRQQQTQIDRIATCVNIPCISNFILKHKLK
jgi:hypothetical protein